MNRKRQRPRPAELVTFGIGLAVVLAVVAGIVSLLFSGAGSGEPRFSVSVVKTHQVGLDHHVRVRVRNDGRATAAQVQVVAELRLPGRPSLPAEQRIAFLAGGAQDEVVFVFSADPDDGELDVRVASYAVP